MLLRACFLISWQLEYEFLKVKTRFSVSSPPPQVPVEQGSARVVVSVVMSVFTGVTGRSWDFQHREAANVSLAGAGLHCGFRGSWPGGSADE